MIRALALVLAACSGQARPIEAPRRGADADHVRLAQDATMGDLLDGLRDAFEARGRGAGECFLLWDEPSENGVTVHVGDRRRSAAVSCDGLSTFGPALDGRCIFLRLYWVVGEDLRTEAMSLYFAPPGRAFAARPIGGAGIAAPAREALFRDEAEDSRTVLAIALERPERDPRQRSPGVGMTEERANPLMDPEIGEAVRQLVAGIQECNPNRGGSLVLEWRVAPDGEITNAEAFSATVSEAAAECALEVVAEASFPEHAEPTPVDYCVPVLLDPALRPE